MNKNIYNNTNNNCIVNTNKSLNNEINISLNNNLNNNIKNEEIEKYELFLHNDTNTSGYTQWFFFRVSNVKKGKKVINNYLKNEFIKIIW